MINNNNSHIKLKTWVDKTLSDMDKKLVTLLKYHWLSTIGKLLGMCDEDGTHVQTQEQWVSTFSQQGDNSPCQKCVIWQFD